MSGIQKDSDTVGAGTSADPSMEDILASIRRILNEDESAPQAAEQAKSVEAPAPETPAPVQTVPSPEVRAEKPAAPLALDASMMVVSPLHSKDEKVNQVTALASNTQENLVSPGTATAAASSISSLVQALSTQRATPVFRDGPTIEDLVREEIRPVVQQWMDQYLPQIVERLVRAEIERVIARVST